MQRAHNFCAGPCTLPTSVLAELADELPNFNDSGMSLIEMSHRSADYDAVHSETLDLARRLFNVPSDFSTLLLQGGATLQFAMIPMNLLATPEAKAAHIVSGSWGKKAFADAKKCASAYSAWSGEDSNFTTLPTMADLNLEDGTRYLHLTSNETIGGIRFNDFVDPGVPIVADMSSDYMSRPIPWDRFDVVYGGAQKNLGPAGLSVVFIRSSLLEEMPDTLPDYLSYKYHEPAGSLANTPPVFAIWATGKVMKWMEASGGVEEMERRAAKRSAMIYDTIDASDGFYTNPVDSAYRSHMNIVFRLGSEDLEKIFLAEADKHDLRNLKGHRSVGGMRASVYNALPTESVQALVDFMGSFSAQHG